MSILDRFSLEGKVALVTGASSGLGVAFAKAMAEAGADVAIGARRVERLEETKRLIEAAGRKGLVVKTDVTDPESCQAFAQAAFKEFGRVDILVNNAGDGGEYHPATEDPPEHFRRVVDLNLMGSYWMAQAAGRVMGPGSSVINISSVMALTTAKMPAAGYSSAKAAVLGLTRDLAAQWGTEKGIRVNGVAPGPIWTPLIPASFEAKDVGEFGQSVPLGRPGQPDEVAPCFVFLASSDSSYMTGQVLHPNGGEIING